MLALALAVLWFAPAVQAAPPANDDFADAESLGLGLPVTVTRTNVEATRELEEPLHGFGSEKTVWFKWEAIETGFVTIGACNSDFNAIVAIYTGSSLGSLAGAVGGSANEGPHCLFGLKEYTFEATAGAEYKIAVTGNGLFPDKESPPGIEGEFELRLEATPHPVNDDFADAATLIGEITEEPGGDRFYSATVRGHNWGATKQVGEPEHAGDPGGASVWYAWTAPESGLAHMSACCGALRTIDVYRGASVDALTRLELTVIPMLSEGIEVDGGITYWIAVDGKTDNGPSSLLMGSFELSVRMTLLPTLRAGGPVPSGHAFADRDTTPPHTTVSKRVLKRTPPVVVLDFASSEPGSTFRCKLDRRGYSACRSPKRLKNLVPGRHTFRVVATDAAGNADPTPAKVRFRIPRQSSSAAGEAGRR